MPLVQPPTIVWLETPLCYEWGCYEIQTTSLCPYFVIFFRVTPLFPFLVLTQNQNMHLIRCLHFSHHWLFGSTLVGVVSGVVMKFTPLPHVLWICGVVLSRLALAFPLVLWFGGTFPWLQIRISKVSLLLFKFLLDLGNIAICRRSESVV